MKDNFKKNEESGFGFNQPGRRKYLPEAVRAAFVARTSVAEKGGVGSRLSRALPWGGFIRRPGPPCSQALTAGPPRDSLWAGVSACGVGGTGWRRRPWCTPTGPQDISPTWIHWSRRRRGLQDVRTHLGQNPHPAHTGQVSRPPAPSSSAGKAGPPLSAFTFRKRLWLDHHSPPAALRDLLLPLR